MFSHSKIAAKAVLCLSIVAPAYAVESADSSASSDSLLAGKQTGARSPTFTLPQVDVTATRLDLVSALEPIQVTLGRHLTSEEASWALRHLPGAFAVGYGGPGALQTLSVGGGVATHTAVLLEGIPLNSPQFGSLDLSTLPIGRIGRIDYLPHGGSSVGAGAALSGAVNLVPKSISNDLMIAGGSFGHRKMSAALANRGGTLGLAMGRQSYVGNFDYSSRGESYVRKNNRFVQDYFQARAITNLGHAKVSASYWLTQTDRGVPGTINRSDADATQADLWSLASVTIDTKGETSRQRWQLYHQRQGFTFDNPGSIPAIYGKHDITLFGAHYAARKLWFETIATLTKIEVRREQLASTDAGRHQRTPWSLLQQFEIALMPRWLLIASGRLSAVGREKFWPSGEIALRVETPWLPLIQQLSALASTNLHQPTFNDLYWQPGGNASLLPERSRVVGARMRLMLPLNIGLRLEAHRSTYSELIVWSPGAGGEWSPANLRFARMIDLPVTWSIPLPLGRGQIEGTVTRHHSINQSEGANHGKALRYNPQLVTRLEATVNLGWHITWTMQESSISDYITFYDFPNDRYRDRRWSRDLHLRWNGSPRAQGGRPAISASVTLSILNATDQDLSSVPGYPAPGRTSMLTIQIERN